MKQNEADMIKADVPAIYGAVVEALWQDGINADKNTRTNFLEDYARAAE